MVLFYHLFTVYVTVNNFKTTYELKHFVSSNSAVSCMVFSIHHSPFGV